MRGVILVSILVVTGCATPLPPPELYAPGPAQMVSEPMRDPIINPSALKAAADQAEREARLRKAAQEQLEREETFRRNANAHIYH